MPEEIFHHPSSYRDNSGFIFEYKDVIYRQVNQNYKDNFEQLIASGLYDHLVREKLIIPHKEVQGIPAEKDAFRVIQPDRIPFISYPYEWTFEMLKDAALLTLKIVGISLDHGMILKDATPFNVQWKDGKFVFIDSLSFEKFTEEPWVAYRQFCESFLGPLLIMKYAKKQLPELLLAWPNGIPVSTVSSMLPGRSRFSLYTYLHIHLHAKYAGKQKVAASAKQFSKQKLRNLIRSLTILTSGLKIPSFNSTWSGYYDEAVQRGDYLAEKKKLFERFISKLERIKTAIDIGANEGEFSKILATKNIQVTATDLDPYCIGRLYEALKGGSHKNIQPLVIDLSMPSPAIGVNNEERSAFLNRAKADLVVALALIHHLCIGKNIPLRMAIAMMSKISNYLIIEFVPKEDAKVKEMLNGRKDIFDEYTRDNFEKNLSEVFNVLEKQPIGESGRILYLAQKK